MARPQPLADATPHALRAVTGEQDVRTRAVDLAAMAHDASHYLLHPRVVVTARDTAHVAQLFRVVTEHELPLTFRSAGTSLSGQAGTEGLLVDTRRHFHRVDVMDGGTRVRSQPGATVRSVNTRLAPHQAKLGPDPASEAACTIGGVIANNSSGMACGTELNAYRTMESMTFVLLSGTTIDTAAPTADEQLHTREPRLWQGFADLRDRVRDDADSVSRIRHQFSMKNTMGYSLNAFLDFDEPVDILSHLLIGSGGNSRLRRRGDAPDGAGASVGRHGSARVRLAQPGHRRSAGPARSRRAHRRTHDAASQRVVQHDPQASAALASLDVEAHTALLVELQATAEQELRDELRTAQDTLSRLALASPAQFTSDPAERAALWHLRKGLYTAVAGACPTGTTALLEDIVVPLPVLTATAERLTELFARYEYDDAVIFGHAKDGNLHFMINPRFDDLEEPRRYEAFTEDLVDLVLAANGSLKAEHGTGRIMAPYVQRQFGDKLYDVMRAVKDLCNPACLLNPGVVLSDDARIHLDHLKAALPVDPAVDACVECGYCEPVCPFRDVTTTPRQRIVLMREIAQAEAAGDLARAREVRQEFAYDAVDTCVADSMCMTACPVAIDTGAVMKRLRADRHGKLMQRSGVAAADHWGATMTGLRAGLRGTDKLPSRLLETTTRAARSVLSRDWVQLVGDDLPGAGPRRPSPARPRDAAAVFFPSCIGSLFGPASTPEEPAPLGATAAFEKLCERAGLSLAVPDGIAGLCCGTPWKSKGLEQGYEAMARRTSEAVWEASEEGRLPVVCEAASCSLGLREIGPHLTGEARERYRSLQIVDAVTYARAELLPRVTVHRRLLSVAMHPTCSSEHLDATGDLTAIADACADTVVVPTSWSCCGFAGDRGLLHPEVTAGATAAQAAELNGRQFDAYVSNNRTCEVGMSRATGQTYRHVLELLESCTR